MRTKSINILFLNDILDHYCPHRGDAYEALLNLQSELTTSSEPPATTTPPSTTET